MTYDETLAARLRQRLGDGVTGKRMFGGLVYLRAGKIVAGVYGADLLVRVGAERMAEALTRPGVRPFVMGERKTQGFVLVEPGRINEWYPEAASG
jgi:TfoX/Sxy family transcriptional regulator of competence genes